MVPQGERAGVLVLRVWLEANDAPRLRVRVTAASAPEWRGDQSTVFASVESVAAFVEEWLREFEGSGL
jgi:hypothetical protein